MSLQVYLRKASFLSPFSTPKILTINIKRLQFTECAGNISFYFSNNKLICGKNEISL